jgi:methionyl-tRNA synthetase
MDGKFYITTAIDYTNNKPHLGHALEKVQADVLARYYRLKLGQDKVWFLTGTDEHGAKIARAAEAAGKNPQEFVDELVGKFQDLKQALNLSFDQFIRTTDEKIHYPGVQKIWNKLLENGDLEKRTYKGLYCVGHEAFVTEKDLVEGKCSDHGKEPEVVEEENWFFKLSKYTGQIKEKIESGKFQILPETRKNEILALLGRGLEDVSFSRPRKDLEWGIQVPNDAEQTIYVWADALTNYISAVGYGRNDDYEKWWPADAQVIGKDISRFHAAIWPGMLLSAGLPLPKKLLVHGFITVDGQKMSKTLGNVIDPVEIAEKYGADALRYYLLKEIPSGEDGDFSQNKFEALYNGDLANGLGNFISRVKKLAENEGVKSGDSKGFGTQVEKLKSEIDRNLENFKINEALQKIWELISEGDKFMNDKEPWKTKDKEIIAELLYLANQIVEIIEPFLPGTAATAKIGDGKPLFPRI